jgi:hypothetical protein
MLKNIIRERIHNKQEQIDTIEKDKRLFKNGKIGLKDY